MAGSVRLQTTEDGGEIVASLRELSCSGLLVAGGADLDLGLAIAGTLEVGGDGRSERFEFLGEVCRHVADAASGCAVGIRFLYVEQHDLERLDRVLAGGSRRVTTVSGSRPVCLHAGA